MTLLPQMQNLSQLSTKWAAIINPILSNPASNPTILSNVVLKSGANSIPHKLGQNLQGWYITRMEGNFAQIYDTQTTNTTPNLTLNLNASTGVTVNIAVF
jgi:hypothetical protein